jgi:general L-amino acid transport system substrate-binding protein
MRITTTGLAAITVALTLAGCGRGDRPVEDTTAPDGDPVVAARPHVAGDSATLRAVKQRGRVNCGVNPGLIGFAYTDNRGEWRGFDVDFCRALAAAVLGDPRAVRFVPLNAEQRLDALKNGQVDVLWRNTSWTLTREAHDALTFAGINYYDGQGFLVRRSLNLNSASELSGARVCVQSGSTSELNVGDYFRSRGIEYRPVVLRTEEEARQAYAREDCDALTADISALAAARVGLSSPQAHAVLPDVISKEPLGPVVRREDEGWASVVRWTLNALILAEELGVTDDNVGEMARESGDPRIRRLLGQEGEFGDMLGLPNDWAQKAIAATGNYGQVFDRNLGSQSTLDLVRGLNAQWNARPGGLIYGLPIR